MRAKAPWVPPLGSGSVHVFSIKLFETFAHLLQQTITEVVWVSMGGFLSLALVLLRGWRKQLESLMTIRRSSSLALRKKFATKVPKVG